MLTLLTLSLFFYLISEGQSEFYPSWVYPVLSALGVSVLGNIAILFRWFLGKSGEDAKTSKINTEQLSIIIQDIQRVTGRYSMLASKITEIEDDCDRRLRLIRRIILDGDEMADKVIPVLDAIKDASLITTIREYVTNRRNLLDQEMAIERERAAKARLENEGKSLL